MINQTLKNMIPNILTILRMIAIPFFVILLLQEHALAALLIFVIACITDYFDGNLARKWKYISKFGQIMDPLADKFLVLSALILLCIEPIAYLHWSVMVIITLREVIISVYRSYHSKKGRIIPAIFWGKLKTTLQMIGIIGALTLYAAFDMFDNFLSPTFVENTILGIQIYFWMVVLITIYSGIHLMRMTITQHDKGDRKWKL